MDLNEIRQAIETLPEDQQRALAKWLRGLPAQRKRRQREERARKARLAEQREFFKTRVLLWTIGTLVLFLIAESAIFRLGWYNKYLEPDSSAGQVESYLFWLS